MSLLGFAIIGKNNEPLYLCDCVRATQEEINKQVSEDYDNKESGQSGGNGIFLGQSLSFENQIIIHSALDQFEELVETLGSSLPVIRRRNNTNRSSRPSNKDPRWVGVLCTVDNENRKVYGYVTATNIKFLLSVEYSSEDEDHEKNEDTIQALFSSAHEAYVSYVMNPFSNDLGPIVASKFDNQICTVLQEYYRKREPPPKAC